MAKALEIAEAEKAAALEEQARQHAMELSAVQEEVRERQRLEDILQAQVSYMKRVLEMHHTARDASPENVMHMHPESVIIPIWE